MLDYKKKMVMLCWILFVAVALSGCQGTAEASRFLPVDGDIQTVEGMFYIACELRDMDGNSEVCYQFRSDDDMVWWLFTEEEIGYKPTLLSQKYYLTYDNAGTTTENKGCDCLPEYECECEVYDDILIAVIPVLSVERLLQVFSGSSIAT